MWTQCNEPSPEVLGEGVRFCSLPLGHEGLHELWYPPRAGAISGGWLNHRWTTERDVQLHLRMVYPEEI
jgi:hypothetical protein